MAKEKPAYITYYGRPLCQCPQLERHGITCGHRSLTKAKSGIKTLRKHYRGLFKVIPGECPGDSKTK